jgi:hypothetical protein
VGHHPSIARLLVSRPHYVYTDGLVIAPLIIPQLTCPLALPIVLARSGAIEIPAMIMSIFGGLLIYSTIISFSMFFQEQEEF